MAHTTNELLRKSLHIAFGLGAFALKWLNWEVAAGVCVVAILSNRMLLHRLVGRGVARDERGYDAGIVLYPVAVLLLVLVFRHQLHFAAIGWALLAFGDGVATLAGKALPSARLPWNREKSWAGFLAFVLVGGAMTFAVAYFLDYREPYVILIATIAAAIAESLPLGIDDNLTVPFAAAVVLIIASIEVVQPFSVWPYSMEWLMVNGLLAIVGFFTRSVSFSGAIGGWILGAILILGGGWPVYVALLAFFIIGTAATKLGYARKARAGLAQEGGGRRGFSHAFSNVGVAAICAIAVSRLARTTQGAFVEIELLPMFMGIAALATAAADTTASEIGQLIGRRAFLPLTLKRVPVGTEGAISIEGTLAGIVGGFLVALAATLSVDRMFGDVVAFSWGMVALLTLCAFAGSYLESVAGSWNRKRMKPVPNGVLNFFNTAVGALLMYFAWQINH
ncbi:MAG TPA: DUF92 domain-containing protein [Thermoanaerobaculia bacterium]|jgi:uncharacterized protein (TIGR00297 family)|nr:DUF92 domain-containing protein [Thermoanaerobaculia bacterium]